MVKVASLFSQVLRHFPRSEFASLVKKHNAERNAKGFTCWSRFVAMTFCHLAGADSLREITGASNAVSESCDTSASSDRQTSPPSPAPTTIGQPSCSRTSFTPASNTSWPRADSDTEKPSSGSKTNRSPSTPPSSPCASRCSPGLNSVAPRAESRSTCSSTTTITCPHSSAST